MPCPGPAVGADRDETGKIGTVLSPFSLNPKRQRNRPPFACGFAMGHVGKRVQLVPEYSAAPLPSFYLTFPVSEYTLTPSLTNPEKSMKSTTKMSGQQRRAAIVEAVGTVFADKGFHATTTRQLAEAAGVSEALLFKHFPSKEAIFPPCSMPACEEGDTRLIERLDAMHPRRPRWSCWSTCWFVACCWGRRRATSTTR